MVTFTAVSGFLDSRIARIRAVEWSLDSGTTSFHCGFSMKVLSGEL